MDLHEELVRWIDALEEAGVDQALCGGAWTGRERFTWDGRAVGAVSAEGVTMRESRIAARTDSTSRSSALTTPKKTEREPVDMSPDAIEKRLRDVAQLRRLGLSLLAARPMDLPADDD